MEDILTVRNIIALIFIAFGLFTYLTEIIGVFHFKYCLNRMHAAGMGDTCGLIFCMIGCMILEGFSITTLKMVFVIVFLMFTSPVATHLLARMEVETNEELDKECEDKTK